MITFLGASASSSITFRLRPDSLSFFCKSYCSEGSGLGGSIKVSF